MEQILIGFPYMKTISPHCSVIANVATLSPEL